MIVTYIDFDLANKDTQKVFNKCIARAIRIVSADHEEVANVRIVSSDQENGKMELAKVYYNPKTNRVVVDYNDGRLQIFGLTKPTFDEKTEKVWVISFDQVWDGDVISHDSLIYANKENAIKCFKEVTTCEKESIYRQLGGKIDNWFMEERLYEAYGKGIWEYWEDGCALINHSYIHLDEMEIRIK